MRLSSSVPPCCRRVWFVAGLLLTTTFVLAVCRSGHHCNICSAVWSSRPQLQVGDGASFIVLYIWALSQLWPERRGGRLYNYHYTVIIRMTRALRWAAMRAIFNVLLIVKKEIETDSNRSTSAHQPNALPLGQTGSHVTETAEYLDMPSER